MTALTCDDGQTRVRFHNRVQFKTIRHVSDFLDQEIIDGWYDKDDFNQMSDDVSKIAALIGDGKTSINGEELCVRGLEHIVEEELADFRAQKMINSIDAVLDEQEDQWDEGIEDPEAIAEMYAEYAKPLLKEAHEIGLKDAEEGYKTWDDLFEDPLYRRQTENQTKTKPEKKENTETNNEEEKSKPKKKKKNNKKQKAEKQDENSEKDIPPTSFSDRSEDPSTTVSPSSVRSIKESPLRQPKPVSSIRSLQSFEASVTLHDSVDLDMEEGEELKGQSDELTKEVETDGDHKKDASPSKQRKTKPRRTLADRKHGSELSPFYYRRDGTLAFKKHDVEKARREQKEKRKNAVSESLSGLLKDDDEDDFLAGILSGKSKRPSSSTADDEDDFLAGILSSKPKRPLSSTTRRVFRNR